MPDTLDLDTLTTAATEAASRGDAVAAASLLRLALAQQVSSLGPDHRDLAPTLNNLAMMLERQGETAEAERCYRRAYDVARRGAPPDDPLVKVSRSNLVAFLHASGVVDPVVDGPPGEPAPAEESPASGPKIEAAPPPAAPRPTASVPPPTAPPPGLSAPPPPAPKPPRAASAPAPSQTAKRAPAPAAAKPAATRSNRRGRFALAIAAGAVAGAIAGWLLLGSPAPDTSGEPTPSSATAPVEPVNLPARPDQSAPVAPGVAAPPAVPANKKTPDAPAPTAAAPEPPARKVPVPAPFPTPRSAGESARDGSAGGSITVEGRICTTLARGGGVWRCEPAGDSTAAGAVYYYSRVRSARDVVVRHRWSHQGAVIRTVTLDVRANPQEGFRTFSRQSLTGRSGAWEVSLLAPDGTVVDTQRFTVTGGRR